MTIQFINKDKYHIDFSCNEHAKGEGLSFDLKIILKEYMNEFSSEIKNELWTHFALEFWFDCGQLIFFPEKKLDNTPTEYDPFPADRLDPYLIVGLTSYLKKYDAYVEQDYDKFSESEFEAWHLDNCKEVFGSVSLALSDSALSNFILNSLNRQQIVFRYFGTSRETEYGEKLLP